ncbi:hypothetical protein [Ectobacillus panaciterrae]|uniref:hypothetical protein n=1 Tax=Ectobacillus panaciterrae TaxID=363872 RepID=UPI000421957D|nr:hypothetical protein [Ectobacillus panaciterrae]
MEIAVIAVILVILLVSLIKTGASSAVHQSTPQTNYSSSDGILEGADCSSADRSTD